MAFLHTWFPRLYYIAMTSKIVPSMNTDTGRVTIRRARHSDLAQVVAIERESFPDPWDAEVMTDALTYFPTTFFVALSGGEVAGFVIGGFEDTGELMYGHICNLATARRFRRLGVGRLLVAREEQQFALELAAGVQLEVRRSNQVGQEFYRRLGYQEAFVIAGYYANGEDAIVMMKWFRF